jgi:hypothetical protein
LLSVYIELGASIPIASVFAWAIWIYNSSLLV